MEACRVSHWRRGTAVIGAIALIMVFMFVATSLGILALGYGHYTYAVKEANEVVASKASENLAVSAKVEGRATKITVTNWGSIPSLIIGIYAVNPDNKNPAYHSLSQPVAVGILSEETFTVSTIIPDNWIVGALTSLGNVFWEGETTTSGSVLTNFIDDRFDTGLDGWTFYWVRLAPGYNRYDLQWDRYNGQPAPSALIYGDGYNVEAGMQKSVDISKWTGEGTLTLSFNWRAKSNWRGSTVTNAHVKILDANTGQQLYKKDLVNGGTYDTGWRSFTADIANHVKGHSKIKIILYLHDVWIVNWNQHNWYDNIKLTGQAK
jgi:hypothetical protein